MKNIILTVCFLLMVQLVFKPPVFADEIIDSKGNIIPCKIVTISDRFVEYKKDGNLYSFSREKESAVYNDYVDVRVKLLYKKESKDQAVTRYFGKIIVKDNENVRIRNENGDIDIPWYRVKFVGCYKP